MTKEQDTLFNIVLYAPDIPGNTGSIGRTCIAIGARLVLIKPYGFELTEKAVRRAGLDYWKHVEIAEYENWEDFIKGESPANDELYFYTKTSDQVYFNQEYKKNCYLIFGAETRGLPQHIFETYPERLYGVPMFSEHVRSLNLSNVATAVAYEALRTLKY
ncbi:MAG: tRNA (uridine(34)/cytosine(34)/5-carboxymethylaminomethyluridine(34)-2'-O)-methyltransferase TrmL [Bacteriovorax sp. MedPE-SWde]|nr:MAG: tRNA (uridine(34)/cytosine(34)/5-carboxymethylaminomethyluridine(34)-2'-O)-methyltransferase TrmL [Bacteriovorax sp. MedPE-SWde]